MKLQFATIEALLALALVLSSVSISSAVANNYQHYYSIEERNTSASSAAYDLMMQISENSSSAACLGAQDPNSCLQNTTRYYIPVYGIKWIGIIGNSSAGENYSEVYCTNSSGNGMKCIGVAV